MRFTITKYKLRITNCATTRVSILYFIFFILNSFTSNAQEIKIRGKFGSDSIKLGKPVEFHLSAHYPEKLNLLFPDSSFTFTPFEMQRKSYVQIGRASCR